MILHPQGPQWSALDDAERLPPLVLVVDDDPSPRSVLERILVAEGFRVATEGGGEDALEAVARINPDLVLLDVLMPGMGGLEVSRRLKEDPHTRLTPILLLTGLSDLHDRIHGLDAGADDFLTKPPERLDLLARVRSLLRQKAFTDQLVEVEEVVLSLARMVEAKDPCTEGHCERLSEMGAVLGERIGLGPGSIEALRIGGILHDVGKVSVPDALLMKESSLTTDEWEVMRRHTVTGEHICRPVHSFQKVLPIIRHHHEKFDGSGYPDGLVGKEIPITARVLQVVDVFDALTAERPYKDAFPVPDAMEVMAGEVERGWWDPEVFDVFQEMVGVGAGIQLEEKV